MTTPADQPDLIAWLRAQLDDDERVARAAAAEWPGEWQGLTDQIANRSADLDAVADHMEVHSPARVLAEVDAKRRILDEHERVLLRKGHGADYYVTAWVCKTCGGLDSVFSDGTLAPGRAAQYPCRTLRLLALPYANGPGYREEWKP